MKRFLIAVALVAMFSSISAHAEVINLITGNSGTATANIGGTYISNFTDIQPTGTGVIKPFLRIENPGNQTLTEQGYNTDCINGSPSGCPLQDKAGTWTHTVLVGALPTVTIGGVKYVEFLLDANEQQSGDSNLLSLNQVQIFLSSAAAPFNGGISFTQTVNSNRAPIISFGAGFTEIFRMSNSNTGSPTVAQDLDRIDMDTSRTHGSGSGDMQLYVRASNFCAGAVCTAAENAKYVTFYSQFGVPSGLYSPNSGFEEWAVRTNSQTTPEPTSLLLLGAGLLGIVAAKRRTR